MPLTAGKHKKEQTQRQKKVFSETLGGCVILVSNNSLMTVSNILQSLPSNYLKDLNPDHYPRKEKMLRIIIWNIKIILMRVEFFVSLLDDVDY